jgi:DNA repair protein SbcD/Mre11
MKILHTADYHIMHLKKMIGEERSYRRSKQSLDELSNIIEDRNPDVIVIAGDIYDGPDPGKDEVYLFHRFLIPLLQRGRQVIVIPGNHDSESKGGKTAIDFMGPMDKAITHLHVALRKSKTIKIGRFGFIIWPWGTYPKKSDPNKFSTRTEYNIGVMHTSLIGAQVSDDGRTMKKGFPHSAALKTIKQFDLDCLLLGDIHEQQEFFNGEAIYCGSLCQTKFTESPDKGVVLLDFEKGTQEFIPIKSPAKLITVEHLDEVNKTDIFRYSVPSKEDALKVLGNKLPENVVKVLYPARISRKENVLESNKKIGWNVSLTPIIKNILKKHGVNDTKGAMAYLRTVVDSKEELILP